MKAEDARPRCALSRRSPHGQSTDQQGWLPHAHGHPLALLAAIAHPVVELHVISDGANLFQGCGPIANQRGAFDWGANLAVFDLIGLGAGKDEFPVGDIDLTAAEAYGLNAVFHIAKHILGIHIPAQHIGVGHARHGRMGKALAAAVACWGIAAEPRVLSVLHIADQYSVFDQGILAAWCALIVNADRSAAVWYCAIIQDRDT